ncbi:MAG TPA: helix-turn-helix transcriptional regulator [Candidatus Massiliomicrobiota merdigallinarum]|nr:helix-turn-helix transcriptional regulator [Candidatus Massilimicrobiota merdigallinarum]
MDQRLKELRLALSLSQEELGKRIGITRAAISNLEKGTRNMSEQTIKSICREFNVSIAWLKEGKGDMFTDLPETILDQLVEEYHLDYFDKELIKKYLDLTDSEREVIKKYIKSLSLK